MKKSFLTLPLSLLCLANLSCGSAYDDASSSPNTTVQEPSTSAPATSDQGSTPATPAAPAEGTLSGSVQPILTANCSCHLGALAPAGMNLESGKAFASTVGVQSTVGSCTKLKRIEAGKADDSVLIKRVEGSSCGAQMPKGRTPLSADHVSTIRKWIEAGAPNN
ncbi:MAG: hypothetical protein HYT87_13290 [Nitrospirae bacterium]|nr:hypothetical protein [Nitrospirota bacterium]